MNWNSSRRYFFGLQYRGLMLFLAVFWAGQVSVLWASEAECESGYEELAERPSFRERWRKYVQEVENDSWLWGFIPLRVFLKPVENNDIPRRFWIFRQYQLPEFKRAWWEYPMHWAQWPARRVTKYFFGSPFEFRPLDGLTFYLVRRPHRWIVREATTQLLHEERDASIWVTIPYAFWMFGVIYEGLHELNKRMLVQKILDDIEANRDHWDWLINNDFRFRDIRNQLERGDLSPVQARQAAWTRNSEVSNYYAQVGEIIAEAEPGDEMPEALVEFLLSTPFYFHIETMAASEIPRGQPDVEYLAGFRGNLSREQLRQLISNQFNAMNGYEVISAYVREQEADTGQRELTTEERVQINRMRRDESLAPMFLFMEGQLPENQLTEDTRRAMTYNRFLGILHQRRLITAGEFNYRLQEHLFWFNRLKQMQVLHMREIRVFHDRDGTSVRRPITYQLLLDEFRFELLGQKRQRRYLTIPNHMNDRAPRDPERLIPNVRMLYLREFRYQDGRPVSLSAVEVERLREYRDFWEHTEEGIEQFADRGDEAFEAMDPRTERFLRHHPYNRYLRALYQRREIRSREELAYRMRQHAFWFTRYREWRTLGVVPLNPSEDPGTPPTPRTLEDQQEILLRQIRNRRFPVPIEPRQVSE